jgi:alpha-N-acetylglucosaminidase
VAAHGQYGGLSRASLARLDREEAPVADPDPGPDAGAGHEAGPARFAGYVPEAFAKAHPKARIYKMRAWEGFAPTYWLDPSDPLFAQLAKRFIELYNQTYGAGDYYLADAFNEMIPPLPRTDRTPPTPNTAMPSPTPPRWKAPPPAPPPCPRRARCASGRLWGAALFLDHRRRPQGDMGDAGLALRRGQGVLDARGRLGLPQPGAQ